jgi:predicted phage terminase large subunit-like protein
MRFSDSQKAASSYVVGQAWGVAGANRYLLAQIRARLGFTESLAALEALLLFERRISASLVEEKANGAAVINVLRTRVPGLIPINPEGGKEVRAAAAEPLVEAGNVWLPDSEFIPCPDGYEPTPVDDFIGETATFPNASHDDQVDGMSQALAWLGARVPTSIESSRAKNPWR